MGIPNTASGTGEEKECVQKAVEDLPYGERVACVGRGVESRGKVEGRERGSG